MTTLEQFNEEVMREFEKLITPRNPIFMFRDLRKFITQKLTEHKDLILKMVRERAPKITKFGYSGDPKCKNCGGTWHNDECDCIGFNKGVQEFLNNLDII